MGSLEIIQIRALEASRLGTDSDVANRQTDKARVASLFCLFFSKVFRFLKASVTPGHS